MSERLTKKQQQQVFHEPMKRTIESRDTPIALPFTIDLGEHLLEVQEETVLVLVHHAHGIGVRLEGEETYKLLMTLQMVFQASLPTSD